MRKIRFIHTADLHLGSRLNIGGKYPGEIGDIIDNAIYNTFTRICDQAIINQVDFLLIAGDIYDQESRSVKANMFFNEQCQRLADNNIPVYIIAGNHDPLSAYSELLTPPKNVHLFSDIPEVKKVIDSDGNMIAAISGCSYNSRAESRKLHQEYKHINGVWNIGLLHTQLELDNKNYIPAGKADLLNIEEINYWALGHLHQFKEVHKSRNRAIIYPGIPQARDMGEDGVGGAILVELKQDFEPDIRFLNLSTIVYYKIEIPIDSIKTGNITDIQNLIINISTELLDENFRIKNEINNPVKGFVVDWVLSGKGEISKILKEEKEEIISYLSEYLREKLLKNSPFIWTRKILDQTTAPIDEELFYNNPVFKNVEKISLLLRENKEFKDELIEELGIIWTDALNHEEEDLTKFELDNKNFQVILGQARQKILEELLARRDKS